MLLKILVFLVMKVMKTKAENHEFDGLKELNLSTSERLKGKCWS